MADDPEHRCFSEHAQCMALLSGLLDTARAEAALRGLLSAPDLARATIYFSHYLFEVFQAQGQAEALFRRLEAWYELQAQGFRTPFESPGNTRSDCHAWGAHPLFHAFATIAGIRPAGFGFERVVIAPLPGPLDRFNARMVHPAGEIVLPPGISGQFRHRTLQRELPSGRTIL